MKKTRVLQIFTLSLLGSLPAIASANIIGLLTTQRGNNITIKYKVLEDARPGIEITQEGGTGCPVQLYRHAAKKDLTYAHFTAHAPTKKNGVPYIEVPLWEERKCLIQACTARTEAGNTQISTKPDVQVIDLYDELLSHPSFEKYWKDFKKGEFELQFVLQRPDASGYEGEQFTTKFLSAKSTANGAVLFQSDYEALKLVDVKLTKGLEPVDPSLKVSEVGNPAVPGHYILKRPTTLLKIAALTLDPEIATSKTPGNPALNGGDGAMLYKYVFHKGQIMDAAGLEALVRKQESWCNLEVRVPKAYASEPTLKIDAQDMRVSMGGGGISFTDAEAERLGIQQYKFYNTNVSEFGLRQPSEWRTHVSLSCTGPGWIPDYLHVQDVMDHFKYQGKTFVGFVSDYRPLQKGAKTLEPALVDPRTVVGHLSAELRPFREDLSIAKMERDWIEWQPDVTRFQASVNPITFKAADAFYKLEMRGMDKELYQIIYKFAFKDGKALTESQIKTAVAQRKADFCTLEARVIDKEAEPYAKKVQIGKTDVRTSGSYEHDLYFKEEVKKADGTTEVTGDFLAIEGSRLYLHNRDSLPIGSVVVDFVTCYDSGSPDITLRGLGRHLRFNGKPLLQGFMTNDKRFQ